MLWQVGDVRRGFVAVIATLNHLVLWLVRQLKRILSVAPGLFCLLYHVSIGKFERLSVVIGTNLDDVTGRKRVVGVVAVFVTDGHLRSLRQRVRQHQLLESHVRAASFIILSSTRRHLAGFSCSRLYGCSDTK